MFYTYNTRYKQTNYTFKFNNLLNVLSIEKNSIPFERYWFKDQQKDTFKKFNNNSHAEYDNIILTMTEFYNDITFYMYFLPDEIYENIEKQLFKLF